MKPTPHAPTAAANGDETGTAKPSLNPAPELAVEEIGGRGGLDPVRYGDWEKNGRCIDF